MIVDAHQHFWQVARGDYFWMTDDVAPIRRDILPPDLDAIAPDLGVVATVLVQAAATLAETEFMLDLAETTPLVHGVVGWVDLEAADVGAVLDRLAINPVFKGVRPMLQDIEDTNWILRPEVLRGLEAVQERGLRFDALILPRHLDVLLDLVARFSDMPIVIDHCAKPVIRDSADPGNAWRDGMAALATYPNVRCKLSGLATEHGRGWQGTRLSDVSTHVLDIFGADRVMWGSDWPVLELVGSYADWLSCAQNLTRHLSKADSQRVFAGTACAFYGIDPSNEALV